MVKDFLGIAAGVFQGVGQKREAVEGAVVVDNLGHLADGAVVPGEPKGGTGYGAEGIAHYIMQKGYLGDALLFQNLDRLVLPTLKPRGDERPPEACACHAVRLGLIVRDNWPDGEGYSFFQRTFGGKHFPAGLKPLVVDQTVGVTFGQFHCLPEHRITGQLRVCESNHPRDFGGLKR